MSPHFTFKQSETVNTFKKHLKTHFFKDIYVYFFKRISIKYGSNDLYSDDRLFDAYVCTDVMFLL